MDEVINMPDRSNNATPLLSLLPKYEEDAGSFYLSLPQDVKEAVNQHASQIQSGEDLLRLAQEYMGAQSAEQYYR